MALGIQLMMAWIAWFGAVSLAGASGLEGPTYTVFSMNLAGTLTTPLLAAILASANLAGDAGRGTLRPLMAWPVSRGQILLSKILLAWGLLIVLHGVHLSATVLIASGLPLEVRSPDPWDEPLRSLSSVWIELGLAAFLVLLPLMAVVTVATAISTLCSQAATAIGVTVGLLLLLEPAKLLIPDSWEPWIFSSHLDTATAIASSRMDQIPASWVDPNIGALIFSSIGATVLSLVVAWVVFTRRAITP
jgi:Cu-processing system permease protein